MLTARAPKTRPSFTPFSYRPSPFTRERVILEYRLFSNRGAQGVQQYVHVFGSAVLQT